MTWGFYGRKTELDQLITILKRGRWFFGKVTGRRRIGKTTLIQQALSNLKDRRVFYVQIPDSSPVGVLSAVADAMDTFQIDSAQIPRPKNLIEFAKAITTMVKKGYIVTLDEFQYFNRAKLQEFCSLLQNEVDRLATAGSEKVPGGLFVLGSIQTEMAALLEDRSAPLYNRTTDEVELTHLDLSSVGEILKAHADQDPERLLFLWNLFEGVPKFYRDCYEQGILKSSREEVLRRLFFESSSPLRTEADNWFLKELHGRYDAILKYVARNAGCSHNDLVNHVQNLSPDTEEQVGGYLKTLIEKYKIIEKRLPIFAKPNSRSNRYYLTDNFLRTWLGALAAPVSALNFSPVKQLVLQAEQRLETLEGFGFEKLIGQLYEERSKNGIGDFQLTSRIQGFWDRSDTELDLVALNSQSKIIRFGSCKRSENKLLDDIPIFNGHIERFLQSFRSYQEWKIERVSIAPVISESARRHIERQGVIPQDLNDLMY